MSMALAKELDTLKTSIIPTYPMTRERAKKLQNAFNAFIKRDFGDDLPWIEQCTSLEEFSLNGLLIYKDEDSRFEDMKTSSSLSTDHKELFDTSWTSQYQEQGVQAESTPSWLHFKELKTLSIFEAWTVHNDPKLNMVSKWSVLFSLAMVLSHWVFQVRFLTRHYTYSRLYHSEGFKGP